ncbi:alpha-2-macroglobulin family protein [Lacipirellula limnantheis]|uniref:MG2 domain protein n=1 Tax=Lacipirellula limnantheis TaxID=2528024 RepID=A0A517TXG3_9BACT|nr:MG2 domain-containing protein [Lacipirellula limnantheis]QDT73061.1 MG2 domain protein [Lacipirellula limnantheis]
MMNFWKLAAALMVLAAGAMWVAKPQAAGGAAAPGSERQQARKLMDDGNFRDALAKFRELTLNDETGDSRAVAEDFQRALNCMQQLNEMSGIDAYREDVAATHETDWIILASIAQSYATIDHQGFMIAGEFRRGQHRGGGKVANAVERDRVRALQLYRQALDIVATKPDAQSTPEARDLLSGFARAVLNGGSYRQPYLLQLLTDVDVLPDYEDGWGYRYNSGPQGAPVDEAGNPIFYDAPADWKSAKNDGERWRWLLAERTRWQPQTNVAEWRERADFLVSQFGVQTMAEYGWWFNRNTDDADVTKSMFALHTLADDETMAKLATGIKRFKLPEEQNYIALQRRIVENSAGASSEWQQAKSSLAQEFENRRQYPRAAQEWKELFAAAPTSSPYRERFEQIVGNWGRLEPVMTQPAGKGATIEYRYRNGKRVEFTARAIKVPELLADMKKYLQSQPKQLDWDQINLENLGHRLVVSGQEKYLGAEAASWALELEPREAHFDRRVTVTTPLQKAGAYLLTAKMEQGNTHRVVVWVADTAIVKKPLEKQALYYVADAVTGKPIPKATVDFFGYWNEALDGGARYQVNTKNFAEKTDAGGLVKLAADEANGRFQWIATATTPQGRLAYLGFSSVWSGQYIDEQYKQVKVFAITDRPVYRPDQEVHFKFWVANAQFDQSDASPYAGQSFVVEIHDARGEKVYTKSLVAGEFGGLEGSFQLPAGAALGQYQLNVVNHGGGSFRVEEYKKPEFEVTVDAPSEPVKLGDKITAKISAKYYFGAPVTEARVKYKVLRTTFNEPWFPPSRWDWLYGPGYWWFGEDYTWFPGWRRWGCSRPAPSWFWQAPEQPEIVAEQEAEIGPDGTYEVTIDTAAAKQFHPNVDHSYQIQAEVVDQSRRTIVANGRVLVAREPFKVYVWTNRGYYRTGDTMELDMAARTIDGKPVKGRGVLRLLKIAYEEGKPVENEVAKWDAPTDAQGRATFQVKASEPGQYRLAYTVTKKIGEESQSIEGGQVIVVRGEGFDGSDFRFNAVEVVADKRDYAPGDKVQLQVSSNRADSTVLLFVRPANGVYLPPQVVTLKGKSTIVEVPVEQRDMPNFFVEAVTVHGGQLHTTVREIFVPPAQRVFDVEVVPSAEAYLPGQKAKVQLKLTDADGKPVVASTVVAVYDKALEYISGGGNVPDIREFFWKWRRSHQPQSETSLSRVDYPVTKPDERVMQDLGVFGASGADDLATLGTSSLADGAARGGMAVGRAMRAVPAAAPMAMAAPEGAVMEFSRLSSANAKAADSAVDLFVDSAGNAAGQPVQPTVRQNFADTALWVANLQTNAEGLAEAELTMPENLTAWKINVWGMGHGTRVGEGSAEVVTRKNIIVRLQAPRFFVETDEVVLSAVVHNYLKEAKQVRVVLELEGDTLQGPESMEKTVEIAADGETRVDWRVKAVREGEATIRMSALTDAESDAMQQSFPVLVHGMLKTESFSGVIRPTETTGKFTVTVPEKRRAEQTRLEVRYSPTLAGAMVDALPYLADYPYGCTEQTLNRFLPAVLTQKTLQQMGVDLKSIQEKRTNLNAQEIGDAAERAAQWKRFERNPVFDETELTSMVQAGVNRLTEMQLSDGGWGWFSGWGEHSTAHTTATVVRGLLVAKQNDVAIVPGVVERGVEWLQRYQREELAKLDNWDREASKSRNEKEPSKPNADNLDALVYLVLTEAQRAGASPPRAEQANAESVDPADNTAQVRNRMRDYLYQDRTKLAVYSLATFGLALEIEQAGGGRQPAADQPAKLGADAARSPDMLKMVMQNLSQYVKQDDENQTAWLDLPGGFWWFWYGSENEAQAYYLKLLVANDPKSEVAPRLVKYLLNNRKHGTYWNSTRDTALVVEAFADYLKATGEAKPNLSLEVLVDGELKKSVEITAETLFTFDNALVLEGEALSAGEHTVELRKKGDGPIYFNGYLTNFTLEDDIQAAGLELKINRKFYKLSPAEKTAATAGGRGQAIEQRVEKYDRKEIRSLEELTSGDLVEIELVVDSKNDYEYILLEDMKAAGFEPVEVRSGFNGNELGAYVEYRDERVALFCRTLARGQHSVSYRLRAEIPGQFSALPAKASGMYAPELRGNSAEFKVRIGD